MPNEIMQERHQTLYLPDGDIILSATLNTTTIQLFRVHRGLLIAHSPVFRDTLSLPTGPEDVNEAVDGVAILRLQDDAKDLAGFLSALYDPAYVSFSIC